MTATTFVTWASILPRRRAIARSEIYITGFHVIRKRSVASEREFDLFDDALGLGPRQIDRQQAVDEIGPEHLHAFGEQEGALKLPRGDAAMQKLPFAVVGLAAADDELIFLERDVELIAREARDRQCEPQSLRRGLDFRMRAMLVGRIAVRAGRVTRSSARSISSKPSRKGEFSVGSRDMSRSPRGASYRCGARRRRPDASAYMEPKLDAIKRRGAAEPALAIDGDEPWRSPHRKERRKGKGQDARLFVIVARRVLRERRRLAEIPPPSSGEANVSPWRRRRAVCAAEQADGAVSFVRWREASACRSAPRSGGAGGGGRRLRRRTPEARARLRRPHAAAEHGAERRGIRARALLYRAVFPPHDATVPRGDLAWRRSVRTKATTCPWERPGG